MKRNLLKTFIPIFILNFGLLQAQEPQITISSEVDKAQITIGDLIRYTVTVTHDEQIAVEMPGLGANLGGFDIRDYEVEDPFTEDKQEIARVHYIISTFFTGEFEIPPLTVTYFVENDSTAKSLSTEPIKIIVESVKPSEEGDIRDIKPPVQLPQTLWDQYRWYFIGAGILFIAIIAFIVYKRKKEGKSILPEKPETKRPPHEIALAALDALKSSGLLEAEEIKRFYIELSDIIRRYIEGRYFIIAIEMTTTEVLEGLSEADIQENDYHLFQTFLDRCDLVKFAKVIPSDSDTQKTIQIAYDIVEHTRVIFTQDLLSDESGKDEKDNIEIMKEEVGGSDSTQSDNKTEPLSTSSIPGENP